MTTQLPTFFDTAKSTPMVDKNGHITANWHNYFNQLNTYLQKTLSNEGVQIPMLTSAQLTTISATQPTNALSFNSDTNQLYIGNTPV